MPFNVSFLASITDKTPPSVAAGTLKVGLSWEGVLEAIGRHRPVLAKEHATAFTPCEFQPGHGPDKDEGTKFAIGVHFGAFDFDDLHESDLPKITSGLEQSGIAHAVISSCSHNGRRKHPDSAYKEPRKEGIYYRLRLLLPFTRMVLVSEWKPFWRAMQTQVFHGLADETCKAVTQRWYVPSYIEGTGVPPIYVSRPGAALDIDRFMESVKAPKTETARAAAAGKVDIEISDLSRVARVLRASKKKRDLGEALSKVVAGDEYAPKGHRHGVTYKLVREVLDRHPAADPERLAALFGPSLAMMQPTHITQDVIVGMCDHKPADGPKVDHTSRIAEAFNGARGEPYAPEDVHEMAELLGARADELSRRWIIQRGDSYYILCDGVYRCYSGSDAANAALRDLAPASTAGVDLYEMTQKGIRRKTIAELMEAYGTVASEVVVDLAAQRARYDPVTREFVEAPCPVRVTAKYNAQVEQWLKLLVGDRHEKLNDWLASVTRLEEPCAALYLEGPPGTGKSLLAYGVAQIFTSDRPSSLTEAMAAFNESIAHCPVVFADETIPADSRGRLKTAELREFIQARTRPLTRKYKPTATLRGSLRLIMAANNRSMLESGAGGETMTQSDLEALVERFLHMPVRVEARAFIEQMPTAKWMEDQVIARHVMWLVENWEVTRQGRFLVSGDATELTESLTSGTGLRALVCQWIAAFLLAPAQFVNQYSKDRLVFADRGRLLVTARAIHEAWTMYLQDKSTPPTPMAISRALNGLAKDAFVHDASGKTVRMREFDLRALAMWGRETNYIDEQMIKEALIALERDQAVGTARAALRPN